MTKFPKLIFSFFASTGFAVVLILLLLLLTFLGTIAQVEHSLYEVKQKYFESFFLLHEVAGVPIPLPGGYLVMLLFSINLMLGGIVRIREKWRTPGILIAHFGILILLAGAFVSFKYSLNGNMMLYERESSDEFVSSYDWDIEIGQAGVGSDLLLIPQEQFKDLGPKDSRVFSSSTLPFDLTLGSYSSNSKPAKAQEGGAGLGRVVGGYYLNSLPVEKETERNVPGVYASILQDTGETTEAILWGSAMGPFTFSSGGSDWTINLSQRRWKVPFTIVLNKFTKKDHPGTRMPASYESEVTKIEGDSREDIRIYMNHPLRHRGYTFFQSSWGPSNAAPNARLYSVFSVVKNPADSVPLYSCIIISFGLLLHYMQVLVRYLRIESKRRTL